VLLRPIGVHYWDEETSDFPWASCEVRADSEDVKEQAAIAAARSDIGSEIAALEKRRDEIRLLQQGMMQELLTGKTRLV